ncbi:cytochrome c1 heme lyase [Ophiostoma piceae UAMH 11346]|uniref:Holocytochrome c-type synthase n=1 Tax=Ophiostoma piceae (strain UAMH 11346) TaxID=1262450 RepID=S3BRG9_OPHP1|nr:cytochrome c1 heme lyase [Ophiostoma piceae UAMH 11346]
MAPAEVCPVDHKTREAWLEQARAHAEAQKANSETPTAPLPPHTATPASIPSPPAQSAHSDQKGFFSGWPSLWASSAPAQPPATATKPASPQHQPPSASPLATGTHQAYNALKAPPAPPPAALGTDRVVSSIPRTTPSDDVYSATMTPAAAPARPVNHEVETGADPVSGNWVYPSERMFFDAMKRKGNDNAQPTDMRVVVPIHNAVNERAWKEILQWEAPYTGAGPGQCGGPRLHSFAGLSTSMTPRARFNTLLGYSAPFDRHDWVVDRCGTQVEYVIDFYAGRPGSGPSPQKPGQPQINFYLDVRPKLNTWEGVKMRALRGVGLQ